MGHAEPGRQLDPAVQPLQEQSGRVGEDKLAFANRLNDELIILRAWVTDAGGFGFEWYIPVEGGITKKAIVFALKRFHHLPIPPWARTTRTSWADTAPAAAAGVVARPLTYP